MTPPWFFVDAVPQGGVVLLDEAESRHAAGSARLREGDAVGVTDGRGVSGEGVIESIERRGKSVAVRLERRQLHAPPSPMVRLLAAIPKGDRAGTMLDMATQLGVAAFTPLLADRAVVRPSESQPSRWRRIAREACKQSRNPWQPTIEPPLSLADALAAAGDDAVVVGDVDGSTVIKEWQAEKPTRVLAIVGPEGGFSDAERELLATRATPLRLGPHVLRTETAAVAMLTALMTMGG